MNDRAPHSGETRLSGVRVVKLYDVVRTAHLERVPRGAPTTILYVSRRYDFDAKIAACVDLRRAGVVGVFAHCLRHPVDVIEINEPVIARAAPRALAAVGGDRLRTAFRGRPARIVTYAIANKDPREASRHYSWRPRVRWWAQNLLVPLVWSRVDRIAFGSDGARALYTNRFPRKRRNLQMQTIPALPAAAIDGEGVLDSSARGDSVVFVGDLSFRKGVPHLVAAWPKVRDGAPAATLTIIGKGVLEPEARQFEEVADGVDVVIDPPRRTILQALSRSRVVVLLSQPTPTWREQVGLPIVEGLANGCIVVTTPETGLADWLREHGHFVVEADESPVEVAEAIVRALRTAKQPQDVLHDLPAEDGRAAAERWLYSESEEDV